MRSVSVLAVLLMLMAVQAAGNDVLEQGFTVPQPQYSPVPIWWWSGDPITPDGIREQIQRIAAGGIHSAIILNLAPSGPLYGSAPDEPPFLTEAWWDLFTLTVEEGKRNNVRIWFYDQLGFSGAGLQARVVRDHPEFRGVTLGRECRDVTGPADVEIPVPVMATPLRAFTARLLTPKEPAPNWIWDGEHPTVPRLYFRRTFELDAPLPAAIATITADNTYVLYVNGTKVGEEHLMTPEGWGKAEQYELGNLLQAGKNVIAVEDESQGIGGLLLRITAGGNEVLVSDGAFRMAKEAPVNWLDPAFDDSAWRPADVLGPHGLDTWGAIKGMSASESHPFGAPLEQVADVSARISEGMLRVSVPEGLHRVMLFYTTPGGFDYQNPEAGAALLDIVHGEIERRYPTELGKTIAGSFQDEFPALPHYSVRLPEEFRRRNGYDLLAKLPALYDDVRDGFGIPGGPSTAQIRCAANDVAAALCEDAFFKPLHAWHEKYGMLCGYDQCRRDADPVRGDEFYVDYFRTMRHYSAPGNDMDGDIKPHQSIAELYNRPRVWCEVFHSSGWGQTMEEIAVLLHPWINWGATLFNPHAIYYSIHGSYWEWAPPDTGWRQPYYVHYPQLSDYVSRLTSLLDKGSLVAEIAVLHPATTIHACRGLTMEVMGAATAARDGYWDVQQKLRDQYTDYLILDEDSLVAGKVEEGALKAGRASFKAVVLPFTRALRGAALQRLRELADAGGLVVFVGTAPETPADMSLPGPEYTAALNSLLSHAVKTETTAEAVAALNAKMPRDIQEPLRAMHRRIEGRDFYFVMSDDKTLAEGQARYDINQRKLWETPAAQGARLSFTANVDGIPEVWDALSGERKPVYDYRRENGHTRVGVELDKTPAPLIAFRAPSEDDPAAMESNFHIQSWERTPSGIVVAGVSRIDATQEPPAVYRAEVQAAGRTYAAEKQAAPPTVIDVPAPFACRLLGTCENSDGSFAWPPSPGAIPVECRAFRYAPEPATETPLVPATLPCVRADYDDSSWPTVLASYGPRAEYTLAQQLKDEEEFAAAGLPLGLPMSQAVYSLRLGIDEDKVFSSALGGKGRIPEEFIDAGDVRAWVLCMVQAQVILPPGTGPLPATFRVGGVNLKRAFVNGQELALSGEQASRARHGDVVLQDGPNTIQILATRTTPGRMRLFYQLLPAESDVLDPDWIWSDETPASGKTTFTTTFEIPENAGILRSIMENAEVVEPTAETRPIQSATMVVALGDIHQIRINGKLLADQGNFDPYFTSRAERYDIAPYIISGSNTIQIEAHDTGAPTGLLMDGLIVLQDGQEIAFASDSSVRANGRPARVLTGAAQGYMGDPATLLLRPRPHPLPEAGWLVGQQPPAAPFDDVIYAISGSKPAPAWLRFRLPPGATALKLRTPGTGTLFVNGEQVVLAQSDAATMTYTAQLPDPFEPVRIAALRLESMAGFEQGAALLEPITFTMGEGRIPLGSWDELGLPHYAGAVVYAQDVTLPDTPGATTVLDLGRVRGSADVTVNGHACGTRILHPYRFDITRALRPGVNHLEIRVFNTLGPHFDAGHPSAHVKEGQTKSGIYGPVRIHALEPIRMELTQTQ